jgi:hypothetical protein
MDLRLCATTEGRNITIEYRWAEGRAERFAEIAAKFVERNVARSSRCLAVRQCGRSPRS